jgi:predicted dehydrogenase
MASGANYKYKATHEVPDTVNALLSYDGLTASLMCTFNNAAGTADGLEILGTEGSLALRDGGLTFTPEIVRDDNRWVVQSWAEAAERAYYSGPQVQAVESPWLKTARLREGGESWRSEGRDDTYTHLANFIASVKSRTPSVEDAAFGHRAAACAHMVNQSIREKRVVAWQS